MLSWLVVGSYAACFRSYVIFFKNKRAGQEASVRNWLLLSVFLHSSYLIVLGFRLGHLPVGNVYQVLTTCAWLFLLVYAFLEISLHEKTMGVFFLPIMFGLHLISSLLIDFDQPLDPLLYDVIFEIHVMLMISAYAGFAISFIASLMYILLSREMKSKRLGIFFERLPSLEFFERLSNQGVNVGLVLVSFGFGLGFYMGLRVWEGGWPFDPKLLAVLVSWGIYLVHYISRKTSGWQGHRAAVVSIIGFNWLLFSFIIVNIFFSTFHNFQ